MSWIKKIIIEYMQVMEKKFICENTMFNKIKYD